MHVSIYLFQNEFLMHYSKKTGVKKYNIIFKTFKTSYNIKHSFFFILHLR